MAKALKQTFYYSRIKLSCYLLFNFGLLGLALFFSHVLFPDYVVLSDLVIALCAVSLTSVVIVLLLHKPLAVITAEAVTIDRCPPLKWKDIKSLHKKTVGKSFMAKEIITFEVKNLHRYKLNFIQRAIKNSEFTAFSIPLYAMDKKDAQAIERLLKKQINSRS